LVESLVSHEKKKSTGFHAQLAATQLPGGKCPVELLRGNVWDVS